MSALNESEKGDAEGSPGPLRQGRLREPLAILVSDLGFITDRYICGRACDLSAAGFGNGRRVLRGALRQNDSRKDAMERWKKASCRHRKGRDPLGIGIETYWRHPKRRGRDPADTAYELEPEGKWPQYSRWTRKALSGSEVRTWSFALYALVGREA
jgi:hypothetical protein